MYEIFWKIELFWREVRNVGWLKLILMVITYQLYIYYTINYKIYKILY